MSLPDFVESGDYIVSPRAVARLRRTRAPDGDRASTRVCLLLRTGPEDELSGNAADQIFEAFRRLAVPASAGAERPARSSGDVSEGLDASGSLSENPSVFRDPIRDEATGAE